MPSNLETRIHSLPKVLGDAVPAYDRRENIEAVTKDSSLPLAGTLALLIVRLRLGPQNKSPLFQRTSFLKKVRTIVGSTPAVGRAEKEWAHSAVQAREKGGAIPTSSS